MDMNTNTQIVCPDCGEDALRHYEVTQVFSGNLSLTPDGTITSDGKRREDPGMDVQDYFACEDCGATWNNDDLLRDDLLRAQERDDEDAA